MSQAAMNMAAITGVGMQATLVETAEGWTLLAREGKRLGYIDAKHIEAQEIVRLQ